MIKIENTNTKLKRYLKELAAFHATGLHFINTYPGGREALALNYPDMFTENFMPGEEINLVYLLIPCCSIKTEFK